MGQVAAGSGEFVSLAPSCSIVEQEDLVCCAALELQAWLSPYVPPTQVDT